MHARAKRFKFLAVAAALVGSAILAGCTTPLAQLTPASTPSVVGGILGQVKLLEDGGFSMDVPIDVYLIGFDAVTAQALQERLQPQEIDHSPGSFDRAFPPDGKAMPLGGPSFRAPTQPTAIFRVIDMTDAFDQAFLAAAAGWKIADSKHNAYDANAAETYLARELPVATGRALNPNAPAMVVIHGGDAMGEHSWRYTYSHGYLEPVRAFGEREPLFAFDVSAIPDPYVYREPSGIGIVFAAIFGRSEVKDYNFPIEASGEKALKILTDLVVDAAHYRFLKGPIYPISTKACHHVTLILAVHSTATTEYLPGFKKAKEWVDVPGLEAAFENLTGDEVTVELKTLALPQDEPVLDALSRGAGGFVTLDALRWYIDENWEKFVTPMDGCEEYLSLLLYSDVAVARAFGGIGMYDVERSHRISFSIVEDLGRIRSQYDGAGADVIAPKDPSRIWNYVNLLYSHETGHLFGQHHPQHLGKTDAASPANSAFESVWSVMSYETGDRTIDFGKNDFAQWTRNRAGYTVKDAMALNLQDTPEFQSAIAHLQMGHWNAAHAALESHVHDADGHTHATGHALPGYHIRDYHFHPWG